MSPSSQSRRGGAGLTAMSGQEAGDSLSSGQQTQLRGRETAGRTAGERELAGQAADKGQAPHAGYGCYGIQVAG